MQNKNFNSQNRLPSPNFGAGSGSGRFNKVPKQKIDSHIITVSWRLLKELIGSLKYNLALFIILIVLASASTAISGLFAQTLIDDYIAPFIGQDNIDFWPLTRFILLMALVYLIGAAATYFYNYIMVSKSQSIIMNLRKKMFQKLQYMSFKIFSRYSIGDLMSRFTNDADTLRQMLSQALNAFISSSLTLAFVLCAMLLLSPALTLIVIAGSCIAIVITKFLAKYSAKYFKDFQSCLGTLNGHIEETINQQKTVKIFAYEKIRIKRFLKLNSQLASDASKANGISNMLMPFLNQLGNFLYVCIAFFGGLFAINNPNIISIGTIVAFLYLIRNFINPIAQISQQFNSIISAVAGAGRIYEITDMKDDNNIGEFEFYIKNDIYFWKNGPKKDKALKTDIDFKHVNFSYSENKPSIIDCSFSVKEGMQIALVGHTGAGKTTIINLLNRFYEIDSGEILLDGINIKNINKFHLRSAISTVLQDSVFFSASVKENIAYGSIKNSLLKNENKADKKLLCDMQSVKQAAKISQSDHFICNLENKYETEINALQNQLSIGQQQLLSIARAAIGQAKILIFDEATSSVDTSTEALMQKGFDEISKNKTCFIIAHRLSTIKNADLILVFEHGKLLEEGNHAKLIEKRGIYYELCKIADNQ